MKARCGFTAVVTGFVLLVASCSSQPLASERFTYPPMQDADAFITIPAGAEEGTLVVEVPADTGLYLTYEHLIIQGKGVVELAFGDVTGGVNEGRLTGVEGAAFYTASDAGTFTVTASRGNGGDRAEPLVVEVLVRACNTMLVSGGTCAP